MTSPTYPLVNGSPYDFSSVELDADGDRINGFKSVEYGDNVERGDVRGNKPWSLGMTRGQYKVDDPSVEMYRADFEELVRKFGSGFYTRQFRLLVSYSNDGQAVTTDTLVRCRFKKRNNSHSQGSDPLTVKVDLDCEGILWNGVPPFPDFPV